MSQFIVVEALDGVGKTTLCRNLATSLRAVCMDTPGTGLRPLRQHVLDALGPDETARALFYTATVIAEGNKARRLTAAGRTVVMDRYWLSTRAYATARGARLPWDALERCVPPPDIVLFLELQEDERQRRLRSRGCTEADLQTLDPDFRQAIRSAWFAAGAHLGARVHHVDVTGADEAEAVRRALAQLQA